MKPFIGSIWFKKKSVYVFDINNEKKIVTAQPFSLDFKFFLTGSAVVRYTAFVSKLTHALAANNSDEKRKIDFEKNSVFTTLFTINFVIFFININ